MVLCSSVEIHAIDLMGPPTATHKTLQISLGLEYSYSEESVEITDHGTIPLENVNSLRRNAFYGKLGLGLRDYLELFVRIGAGTLQADEISFDGNTDPMVGWGAKVTFYRREEIDLGALFQWSTLEEDRTGLIDGWGSNAREEIRIDEQHIAIGATVHLDRWQLYGGPFYYVFDGDVTLTDIANPLRKLRPDVEEESEYGGYIGGQFDLGAAGHMNVEYVSTGESWGAGIGLTRMF